MFVCSNDIKENESDATCECCSKQFHVTCMGFPCEDKLSNLKLIWICSFCGNSNIAHRMFDKVCIPSHFNRYELLVDQGDEECITDMPNQSTKKRDGRKCTRSKKRSRICECTEFMLVARKKNKVKQGTRKVSVSKGRKVLMEITLVINRRLDLTKMKRRMRSCIQNGVEEDAVFDNDLKNRSFDTLKHGTDNDTDMSFIGDAHSINPLESSSDTYIKDEDIEKAIDAKMYTCTDETETEVEFVADLGLHFVNFNSLEQTRTTKEDKTSKRTLPCPSNQADVKMKHVFKKCRSKWQLEEEIDEVVDKSPETFQDHVDPKGKKRRLTLETVTDTVLYFVLKAGKVCTSIA
nr:uncharacterized protein LOC129284048 [Lytechinus pictus]